MHGRCVLVRWTQKNTLGKLPQETELLAWTLVGSGFLPCDGGDWVAAEYDLGGGGGAAPMVLVIEGWSDPNGGFNFWLNRSSGCRVMGIGVSGLGGGGIISF